MSQSTSAAGTTKKLAQTLQAAGAPGTWIIKSHVEDFGKFRDFRNSSGIHTFTALV